MQFMDDDEHASHLYGFQKVIECGQPFIVAIQGDDRVIFKMPLHKAEDELAAHVWCNIEGLLNDYVGEEINEDSELRLIQGTAGQRSRLLHVWKQLFLETGHMKDVVTSCVQHMVRHTKWQQLDARDSTAQQSTGV
eukprot:jgi/Chrzof1/2946/Cz12g05130.t1